MLAFGLERDGSRRARGRSSPRRGRRSSTPPHGDVAVGAAGIGIVGRGQSKPSGSHGERESGLRQRELAVGGDAMDPHVPGCAAGDRGVDAHTGQWRPPGQCDTVDDLAEQHAARARGGRRWPGRSPPASSRWRPFRTCVEVAAETEPARVRELVVLRRRPARRTTSPAAARAARPPGRRRVRSPCPACGSVTVAGGGGAASSTVQNGWSSGAASMVNAFMHQYGEPAELYDSAIRRLS